MRNKLLIIIFSSSLILLNCLPVGSDFADLRSDLLQSLGDSVRHETEVEFALGSICMSLADMGIRISNDHDEEAEILHHIDGIQVGIYNLDNDDDADIPHLIKQMAGRIESDGWEMMMRIKEKSELDLLYYKTRRSQIKQILFCAYSDKELVLVEVKGDLNRLVESCKSGKFCFHDKVAEARDAY